MAELQGRYGANLFTLVDESLTLQRMKELSRLLVEAGLGVAWNGATRFSKALDQETAKQLYRGGCRKLQFGLESYNQRLLKLMRKGVLIDWIRPNIENCLAAGIAVHLFTIAGFPTETREEVERTLRFAREMLRLSSDVYGINYSTMAISPFALDVFSDIYAHGARYSVTAQASAGLDLIAKYEVLTGSLSGECSLSSTTTTGSIQS